MKLLLLNLLAMAITCSPSSFNNQRVVKEAKNKNVQDMAESMPNYREIDMREELFKDYYDDLSDSAKQKYNIQDFKELYFSGNSDIGELVENINTQEKQEPFLNSPKRVDIPAFITTLGPTCYNEVDDADFIISNNHNSNTYGANETPLPATYDDNERSYYPEKSTMREFDLGSNGPRAPKYYGNNLNKYQRYFHEGDIVWDTVSEQEGDFANLVTHMGIIVNLHKQGRERIKGNKTFEFVETVEAYASGVRFGFIDDERILRYGTKVLEVYASDTEKRHAVEFMLSQLGKPYTLKVPDMNTQGKPIPGASSPTWYCTQLVFSAYYIPSGINLCKNNRDSEYYGKDGVYYHNITGHMIYDGSKTTEIGIYLEDAYDEFLDIEVMSEGNDYYNVKIKNFTDSRKLVGYSDVMKCFDVLSRGGVNCSTKYMYMEAMESKIVKVHKIAFRNAFQAFFVKNNRVHYTIAHYFLQYVNVGRCLQFNYVKPLEIEDALYPKLFVQSYSNNKWTIGIANISSSGKNFYYNQKTVNILDAAYWANLDSVSSKYIYASSFDTVEITQINNYSQYELPRDSITFSCSAYGNRYVGYAQELNSSWKSLAFKQNIIGSNPIPSNTTTPTVTKDGYTEYVPFYPTNFEMHSGHGQDWYEMHLTIPAKKIDESVWDTVIATDYETFSMVNFTCDSIYFDTETGEFNVTLYSRELNFPFGAVRVHYEYETELLLDSIELSGKYKQTFFVGEPFTYEGLIVTARYTCGDTQEVDDYQVFDDNVHTNFPGTYPVKIQYTENGITKTKEYSVVVRKPYLDSVQLLTNNVQTTFEIGETFNCDGLVVRCLFENGTWSYASNFDIDDSEAVMNRPGQYTIRVTCNENESFATGEYQITVVDVPIQTLEFEGDFETLYGTNDELNFDGLEVYVRYENNYRERIYNFTINDSEVNMSVPGTYQVYVETTVNDAFVSSPITINVEDRSLISITLSGEIQTVFEVGDNFNYDGLIVTANYANGDSAVVTDYSVITRNINMNQAGTYTVRVRYEEDGISVTQSYQITVVYNGPTLTSISLSGDYQTVFTLGESFSYSGLVVTAHYSDGSSAQVTGFSVAAFHYNPLSVGSYTVIVNYSDNGGFAIASYTVTVVSNLMPRFLESTTLSGNYKTTFRAGQAFNTNNLVVTAHYSDGSSAVVTDYEVDVRGVNMSETGIYTVRIIYSELFGGTAVATYDIFVIGKIIFDPKDPIIPIPGKF